MNVILCADSIFALKSCLISHVGRPERSIVKLSGVVSLFPPFSMKWVSKTFPNLIVKNTTLRPFL